MRSYDAALLVSLFVGIACTAKDDTPVRNGAIWNGSQAVPAIPVVFPVTMGSVNPIATAVPPAAPTPGSAASASDAATAFLQTLTELVARRSPGGFGFQSVEEVQSAELGASLPVLMVRLDSLRAHQPGQSVRNIFVDKQEMVYPVAVRGEIRTSVVVRKRDPGVWDAVEFRRGDAVKEAVATRLAITARTGLSAASVSLVEIPGLSMNLLGYDHNGAFMLALTRDLPATGFRAGETHSASEFLAAVQPLAASAPNQGP
jgi:hypothetical protein